jgi:hypothetical protein
MCSLINANQLLQEESHGGWKKVDKFANVDNLLQMDDVINAAKDANAHDFITKLTDGYETQVS